MKIFVAKDAGYCFGVRDAVNLAYEVSEKHGNVYMLWDIVHNENVVKDLKNAGSKVVNSLDDIPRRKPILFRAHGTVNELWESAKNKDMNIVYNQSSPEKIPNIFIKDSYEKNNEKIMNIFIPIKNYNIDTESIQNKMNDEKLNDTPKKQNKKVIKENYKEKYNSNFRFNVNLNLENLINANNKTNKKNIHEKPKIDLNTNMNSKSKDNIHSCVRAANQHQHPSWKI